MWKPFVLWWLLSRVGESPAAQQSMNGLVEEETKFIEKIRMKIKIKCKNRKKKPHYFVACINS
jgi:hypothetical protein